jgi:hypothetical protein
MRRWLPVSSFAVLKLKMGLKNQQLSAIPPAQKFSSQLPKPEPFLVHQIKHTECR